MFTLIFLKDLMTKNSGTFSIQQIVLLKGIFLVLATLQDLDGDNSDISA